MTVPLYNAYHGYQQHQRDDNEPDHPENPHPKGFGRRTFFPDRGMLNRL
ncbi:hypothetical protein ABDD95_07180 [Mucilaginibacter sp. PAMB04274]